MKKQLIFLLATLIISFGYSNRSQAQEIKLGANLALGLPGGDFNDAFDTGFGFYADAKFFVLEALAIDANIGYYSFPLDDGDADIEASFRIVPIRAGVEYYFIPGPIRPYAGAGLGVYIGSLGGDDVPDRLDDSETEVGAHLGGGALFRVGEGIDINGGLRYNIIEDASFLELNVGVLFSL